VILIGICPAIRAGTILGWRYSTFGDLQVKQGVQELREKLVVIAGRIVFSFPEGPGLVDSLNPVNFLSYQNMFS